MPTRVDAVKLTHTLLPFDPFGPLPGAESRANMAYPSMSLQIISPSPGLLRMHACSVLVAALVVCEPRVSMAAPLSDEVPSDRVPSIVSAGSIGEWAPTPSPRLLDNLISYYDVYDENSFKRDPYGPSTGDDDNYGACYRGKRNWANECPGECMSNFGPGGICPGGSMCCCKYDDDYYGGQTDDDHLSNCEWLATCNVDVAFTCLCSCVRTSSFSSHSKRLRHR